MGRADRISGGFWLFFSVLVSIESYRLGLGTLHQPGPGFLFFWTSVGVGILSIVVLIRAWATVKAGKPEGPIFAKNNLLKIILVLLSLFLYALFMETLGFIPVTLLLFIFLLGMIEKKGWWFSALVSLVVTGIAYLIFQKWLQSQLPEGLLGLLRF